MTIGIITIHNSPNYGACLQSYALYKYLEQQGYEVEVIDLHRPYQEDYIQSKKYKAARMVKLPFKKKLKRLIRGILRFKSNKQSLFSPEAKKKFDEFNSQIKLTKPYYGIDELYASPPVFDLYVAGSDQIWNPTQSYCLEPYFLTFAPKGSRKISFASSIGITDLTHTEKKNFREWLSSFSSISVREIQAKTLLESFIDQKVYLMPDPTFLLENEFWKSLAKTQTHRKPYILLFTLNYNEALLNYGQRLSAESGKILVSLCQIQPDSDSNSYIAVKDAGPKDFLAWLMDADLVITNSFHGTVFSIIMGANNFYVHITDNTRGSRIVNLLDTYGLSEHLLDSRLQLTCQQLMERKIDHSKINDIMKHERERSREFLNLHLK